MFLSLKIPDEKSVLLMPLVFPSRKPSYSAILIFSLTTKQHAYFHFQKYNNVMAAFLVSLVLVSTIFQRSKWHVQICKDINNEGIGIVGESQG